jgi:hypothetical protein
MSLSSDEFERLERLRYRPISARPDWLKAWRNEANYLLFLARRAADNADDEELEARDRRTFITCSPTASASVNPGLRRRHPPHRLHHRPGADPQDPHARR